MWFSKSNHNSSVKWISDLAVLLPQQTEEEHSPKLSGQPWVWSASNFIFLASAYEGGWPVLSLTVSSSHWQSTVNVHIVAEFATKYTVIVSSYCFVTLVFDTGATGQSIPPPDYTRG